MKRDKTIGDTAYKYRGWLLGGYGVLVVVLSPLEGAVNNWGIGLGLLAGVIRFSAALYIEGHTNGSRPEAPALARTGLYGFCRHPLYLSNILAALGLLILLGVSEFYILASAIAAIWLHHELLISREEKTLRHLFPVDYSSYRDEVGKWFSSPAHIFRINWAIKTPTAKAARTQGPNLFKMLLAFIFVLTAKHAAAFL